MASKVIRLPLIKKSSLSRQMIVALVEAGAKQMHGVPFGPADIKGSFSFLIERGLVEFKHVDLHNGKQHMWQLTPEAKKMLTKLGVDNALNV